MKKFINKVLFIFSIFIFFMLFAPNVKANTINRIDMDVYIDENGNASITEVWDANLNQGTEGYKPYTKLGNSTISNFSVKDETGTIYENMSTWDSNNSFSDKAYTSGINKIYNGVELCWGISNYGNKTYTLKYNISNFVNKYTDTQGIYFNFLNLDMPVSSAKITIHSNVVFSLDNSRIWAFGNNGTINFENGSIVLDSDGRLSTSQYMVALVRFESNIFNTSSIVNQSFDDVYKSAFSTVNEKELENTNKKQKWYNKVTPLTIILAIIIGSIPAIFVLYSPLLLEYLFIKLGRIISNIILVISDKILVKNNNINYWREVPCDKDLAIAYLICNKNKIIEESRLKQGLIGAIILKWIKNGNVKIIETKKSLFSFKNNNYAILFLDMDDDGSIEYQLFRILIFASDFNRVLTLKRFKKWSKKNYDVLDRWFSKILREEKEKLNDQYSNKEECDKIKGFKKFLLDFSTMSEKEYIDIYVWEDYLIFAHLLGIAKKVTKQLDIIYPNFDKQLLLNTYVANDLVFDMTKVYIDGIHLAKFTEDIKSYSSGSGDYSGSDRYSGGGGGSFSSGGDSSGGFSGGGFR